MTTKERIRRLERRLRPGRRPQAIVYFEKGQYHRGGEVLTDDDMTALRATHDIFTIELCEEWPPEGAA